MGRPAKSIDIEKVLDLLEEGVPQKEIAKETGVSVPTLARRIGEIQAEQGVVLQYRALQNVELTALQARILENITDEKIAEASLRDLAAAFKILKDAENVDMGKPTEIKGLVSYLVHLEKEELAAKTPINIPEENMSIIDVTDDGMPKL